MNNLPLSTYSQAYPGLPIENHLRFNRVNGGARVDGGIIKKNQFLLFDDAGQWPPRNSFYSDVLTVSENGKGVLDACLLYTSPSPRDRQRSRMPSSA